MKELAAETLMVGSVDSDFEKKKKKAQLICVTKKLVLLSMYSICMRFH